MNAEIIAQALGKFTPKHGGGFTACCPSHQDDNPSLSIDDSDNGSVLVKCWAGCSQDAVIAALKDRGLWPTKSKPEPEAHVKPKVVGVFRYRDQDGREIYRKERLEPGRGGRKKEFRFRHDDPANGENAFGHGKHNPHILYNLDKVIPAETVYFNEGEKQADVFIKWGLIGTTLDCGSQSSLNDDMKQALDALTEKNIALVADNDDTGRRYMEAVATYLYGKVKKIKVVNLPGLPEKGDVCDWICTAANNKRKFQEIASEFPEWEPSETSSSELNPEMDSEPTRDTWSEPLLFGEIETPDISPALLPETLAGYCRAVVESTQTPSGMAIMMALATIATCLQKRFEVSPFGDSYTEPVNIMTVTALDPASRKSAIVKSMTEPLTAWEIQQAEELKELAGRTRHERDMVIKSIESIKSTASKASATDDDRRAALTEIRRLEDSIPPEIIVPRLWIDDVTPERLQNLMADNGERISVISAEGGIFEVISGLYSGGKSNINVILQSHAGEPVRVERQGRSVTMLKPALTFGLTVQPEIISKLASGAKSGFRGNGMLARLLYCIPISTVGNRDVTRRRPVPEKLRTEYHSLIYRLLSIPPLSDEHGKEQPRLLSLAPDALRAWLTFSQYIETKQGQYGEFHSIQDWTGKLPGAALRIAGLCHVVEHGEFVTVISKATIEKSLDLAELLIVHAKAAFAMMGSDQAIPDAKIVLQWILKNNTDSFRRNELHKALHGRFDRVDRLISALRVLAERHIISDPIERQTGSRPEIRYMVNPFLLKGGNHGLA